MQLDIRKESDNNIHEILINDEFKLRIDKQGFVNIVGEFESSPAYFDVNDEDFDYLIKALEKAREIWRTK